jgi:hypothetical protein
MRALTLWRPWPHAILYGGKRVENRPWKPWRSVLGQTIALHAGLRYDDDGAKWMAKNGLYEPPADQWCPKGCIVGTAKITECVDERPMNDSWFFGPFGWLLDDVVAFETPVICRGAQGLWKVPADVLFKVEVSMKMARKKDQEKTP